MPVPELEKFREKYPEYGDISDTDLADKLASKYPEAYKDLPQRVAASEQGEFTKARQEAATEEPAFRGLARATLPTLAAGAAFIPGPQQPYLASMAGQAILGATATGINQAVGLEEPSGVEIAKSAALPFITGGALRTGKALTKGGVELVAPGVLKEAGVEAGAESLGSPATSLQRAFTTPASQGAFLKAKQIGAIPTGQMAQDIASEIQKLQSLSNPPRGAIKYLQNLEKKLTNTPIVDYGDMVTEVQLIKQNADMALGKNKPTGAALYAVRSKMLDQLDNISPAVKEANRLYRQEESAREVIAALRSSNAANKLRTLFENDPLVSKTYKPEDYKILEKVAMEITDIPSAGAVGLGRTIVMAATEPIAHALTTTPGRFLVRQLMKPTGKITDVGAATIAQFMRAYNASQGQAINTEEFKTAFDRTMRSPAISTGDKIKAATDKGQLEKANREVEDILANY